MRKVALIGNGAVALAFEIMETAKSKGIQIVAIEQEQNNIVFEPEPFIIKDYNLGMVQQEKYYEHQQSKFFGKPKRNFRKK